VPQVNQLLNGIVPCDIWGAELANYEIIVTDVTRYGSLYCIAGWDFRNSVMIRPEPSTANAVAEASRFQTRPVLVSLLRSETLCDLKPRLLLTIFLFHMPLKIVSFQQRPK
jgi:hypothetical protein